MKYVIRVLALLAIWATITVLIMGVFNAFPAAEPIEPAEGMEGEAAWSWWLAASVGLLITLAIALGGWVYYRRRKLDNRGTDLRGGA